jgi:eukaryotic-like serine/threonine-protein kinase
MPLSAGTKLGPYEILSKIGAGGMGEVWKARDTRLDRIVALKVSKSEFSERFEREARAVAALNHPNICTLHDIGPNYLVMEFIEGTPLKGPWPVDQALKYGAQICEALDAAHKKGITHRDLKPGNILVTKAGVKLLDFGLAKIAQTAETVNDATVTMALTGKNEIVGTLYYMSPEQLQAQGSGQDIDARSDIFSFGLVLYEMLTGKRAFEGSSPASVIAAIMERPAPSIAAIAPPALDRLLQRCLAKDRDDRWQSARDLKAELDWIASASGESLTDQSPSTSRLRNLGWIAAGVAIGIAASFGIVAYRATPHAEPKPLVRLDADVGGEVSLGSGEGSTLAIAPDGSRLAFVTPASDGKDRLALRLLESTQTTVLPDTEGAANPFFSPDGRWIAFIAGGKLKKISVEGGKAITLCDAPNPRGASWGEDGNIVFAPENRVALSRVSSNGGDPKPATQLDTKTGEITNRYPQVLPGGEAFLFHSRTPQLNNEEATVYVQPTKAGPSKLLVTGGYYAHYLPSGHLVYMRQGTLYAAPMDLKRLELTGPAVPVVDDVRSGGGPGVAGNGYAYFDFTRTGTLVYVAADEITEQSLFWLDAAGALAPIPAPPGRYTHVRMSPDGGRLALLAHESTGTSISIYELAQNRMSLVASFNGVVPSFGWAPDSKHLVFDMRTKQLSGSGIYWMRADGAGMPLRIVEGENWIFGSLSSDGKRLGYWSRVPPYGLWTLALDVADPDRAKPGKPEPLLKSNVEVRGPTFSPDGRWFGYSSNESARMEAYVRPFPGPGGKWQVSAGGAGWPIWSPNGHELYYLATGGRIRVVDYSAQQDSFAAGQPQPWPEKGPAVGFGSYLAADGKRFVVLLPTAQGEVKLQTRVVFLENFFDELRRKAPANGK